MEKQEEIERAAAGIGVGFAEDGRVLVEEAGGAGGAAVEADAGGGGEEPALAVVAPGGGVEVVGVPGVGLVVELAEGEGGGVAFEGGPALEEDFGDGGGDLGLGVEGEGGPVAGEGGGGGVGVPGEAGEAVEVGLGAEVAGPVGGVVGVGDADDGAAGGVGQEIGEGGVVLGGGVEVGFPLGGEEAEVGVVEDVVDLDFDLLPTATDEEFGFIAGVSMGDLGFEVASIMVLG